MSKYSETLDYMYRKLPMYQRVGGKALKKSLDNIIALCDKLGNPQNDFKSIHIAGTNGKGTVTHLIASALVSSGYKVGIYTSPHYKDFRERIKIANQFVSKKYVVHFVNSNRKIIESIEPSFFEITVAMAFKYFSDQNVDVAVIEVGLGGRLDSTNIIAPILSVITNISLDHTSMLGNTLHAIAIEKGGIIKKEVPVVIGEKNKKTDDIFSQLAEKNSSDIYFAENDILVKLQTVKENSICKMNYEGKTYEFPINLRTDYQRKNLITALKSISVLSKLITLDFEKILSKYANFEEQVHYIGRWQKLENNPLIIADSGHNEAGIKSLLSSIAKLEKKRIHCVLGFANDKDVSGLLSLFPKSWKFYFCKADVPRGLSAVELKQKAQEIGLRGKSYKSVRLAFAAAKKSVRENEMVFIGGSIFVVAEVI